MRLKFCMTIIAVLTRENKQTRPWLFFGSCTMLQTEKHVRMPETYKDPLFFYYNLWKVQNNKEKTKQIHTNDNNWLKLIN